MVTSIGTLVEPAEESTSLVICPLRVLKTVRTVGAYRYSMHDSSWIEFMRRGGWMEPDTLKNVTKSYWQGEAVRR